MTELNGNTVTTALLRRIMEMELREKITVVISVFEHSLFPFTSHGSSGGSIIHVWGR
jgi:hypothetical protein